MRTKILVLSFALALSANLYAQVTIGELAEPTAGASLALNKAVKGGLTLSTVDLPNFHTIPATFPGMTPTPSNMDAVKTGFKGALVYNTGVTSPPAGIYVWNGSNWTPATENCLPADSLAVTLNSSATVVKTGNPVTFSVSSDAGERCSEGETYDWYQAATAGSYGAAGTTAYPTSSKSIAFSPADAYKVKVEASNIYSASSAKATSNEVTVYVTDDAGVLPTLYGNNYDVLGAPCYDVYRSTTEPETGYIARADSFATGYEKTYLFDYKGAYSDLQVSYEDPHGLVDHIIQPVNKSSSTAPGKELFTVVFKPGMKTSVPTSGRDTVKLWVSYKVGTEAKLALRNIRFQDAFCHCPARIDRLSDRWLTFQCHNLGGSDITSSSQTLTRDHHGNWYRFGAKAVSMANTSAHDTNNTWNNSSYQSNSADWANAGTPPCPAGWRLPDIDELAGVINFSRPNTGITFFSNITPVNNELAYLGTWSTSRTDKTNFSAYVKVGDYLLLPAAGCRDFSDGSLDDRGYSGYYWSGSASGSRGWGADFDSGSRGVGDGSRALGFSVRCVAVESN
jgi:uncharacterized protein (TIGR02145 family)